MRQEKKRVNGRGLVQAVTATQEWRDRFLRARASLPEGVGQQDVIEEVIVIRPQIDSLRFKTRWHNAWTGKNGDPEITMAVEQAAQNLKERQENVEDRIAKKRRRPKN